MITRRNLLKGLGALAVAAVPLISGCEAEQKDVYKEGTVVGEYGSLAGLEESSGAFFGNESVRIRNPDYVLEIQTEDGIYTAKVIPYPDSLEALAVAIKPGAKVKFMVKNCYGKDNFREDRIGTIWTNEIKVLKRAEQGK